LDETPTIYVSPVNLDPVAPAQPISAPNEFAAEIAADVGRFYTQGMPEDTKALVGGVLSDADFLAQEQIVFEERHAMLRRELDRFDEGFLFFYFSSVDLVSHMFWRALKPGASDADKAHADVIPALYAKMDGVLGEVLEAAGPDTTVIAMSDHGFAPYDTKVHLNTWLARKGYLVVAPPDQVAPGVLGHIDWPRTRAYALGLNQLFLNRVGREPHGIVEDDQAPWLLEELARELEDFVDPRTGQQVVSRVFTPHQGTFLDRVPDLIVGYNRGFRSSDESALGEVGTQVLEVNRDKWSGDHCMDPAHVPGVLLTNRKLREGSWALTDVAPTVRTFFEIDDGGGRSFLE
jgi:predicted AlkP superfamily phosphohydrolase/phosphomutase